ncbi:hypothetical protein ACFUNF_04635 [Streptomyces sp. NPDC057291]|uniref:hypothetical protein n=1 Tax=Streptomyces sp. NPDC057291 TaxID=3346087 RepID=UPI00364490B9
MDFRRHRAPGVPLVLAALVPSHAGPCDHGLCALADLLAVERLDDPRCVAGHHPEAVRTTPDHAANAGPRLAVATVVITAAPKGLALPGS